MKTITLKNQKSSDVMWKDEKGIEIPYNRTTKSERLMEIQSLKIAKEALKINNSLVDFKQMVQDTCKKVYDAFMEEKNNKQSTKGNFTWYNFNRTIKIEVSISEPIKFDELTIIACKDKLDEFLKDAVESKEDYVKEMVTDAFETSRGKLDVDKILSLLKWRSKIKKPLFQEALDLLESAIRRPSSKTYFRVWVLGEDGKYENIQLNFSSL